MTSSTVFEEDFENLKFDPFSSDKILLDNCNDPDSNFFRNNFQNLDTRYFSCDESSLFCDSHHQKSQLFSILHVNIRSMNRNFENFKRFLADTNELFKILCISETWCDKNSCESSHFQLPGYSHVNQVRDIQHKNGKGGGLSVFIHKSLLSKVRSDLNVNTKHMESLSVEIVNNKSKNIVITTTYRPPDGNIKTFETFLKALYSKVTSSNKLFYLVGDLNLNVLDYDVNEKVKKFSKLNFSAWSSSSN